MIANSTPSSPDVTATPATLWDCNLAPDYAEPLGRVRRAARMRLSVRSDDYLCIMLQQQKHPDRTVSLRQSVGLVETGGDWRSEASLASNRDQRSDEQDVKVSWPDCDRSVGGSASAQT